VCPGDQRRASLGTVPGRIFAQKFEQGLGIGLGHAHVEQILAISVPLQRCGGFIDTGSVDFTSAPVRGDLAPPGLPIQVPWMDSNGTVRGTHASDRSSIGA